MSPRLEALRTQAITLRETGMPVYRIAQALQTHEDRVRKWCVGVEVKATKKGSGVIAGPPYAIGYRYFNTKL